MSGGWDRLTPEGERFYAEIEKLKKLQVFVGFQSGQVRDDRGVDIAQIAMFNELGTSTSPSRPFLRMSVDENESKIKAMAGKNLKTLTSGGTAETILKQTGAFGVSLVQEKIGSGTWFKMKLERRELVCQLSPETAVNVLLACWDYLETGERPGDLSPIESVAFDWFMSAKKEAGAGK